MSYQEIITYDTANALNFDSTAVEVASGTLRLKDLGGGTYSTANPLVTTQHVNVLSSLTSFAESVSAPTGSATGYTVSINRIAYYWNSTTTVWTIADGTYALSNSASVLAAHVGTLFSDLNLVGNQYFSLNIFLNSNGTVRPQLTSNTLGYTFTNQNPSTPNQCLLFANINDLIGGIPAVSTTQPITLYVSGSQSFFYGQTLILPFTKSVNFNSSGYAQLAVIETATPGVSLEFSVSYFDGISRANVKLFNAIVPNVASAPLSSITRPRGIDFG